MTYTYRQISAWLIIHTLFVSCTQTPQGPSAAAIAALELKQGRFITCGPEQNALGTLSFKATVSAQQAPLLATGVKLLHSFEYEEAEKAFAALINAAPSCYMAYWGVVMSNFHPLWAPPLPAELKKGAAAIAIARQLKAPTAREAAYLDAIAAFYDDYQHTDHRTRTQRFEQAMQQLQATYPDDVEAKIFYALSLDAAADPADKTYAKQQQAGELLKALYAKYPQHAGVVHYLIHAYDAPGMAQQALTAARNYAIIAPSSAHALHTMLAAANREDATEKHPVSPAEVSPAREQLGDLLLAQHQPEAALVAYETSLQRNPNRFNS